MTDTSTEQQVRVVLWGYGGEFAMGRVPNETWQWWSEQDEYHLESWMAGDLDESEVPEGHRFVESGCWYDCDDILHHSGIEMSSACGITVTDASTNQVLLESRSLDPDDLMDFEIQTECEDEFYACYQALGTRIFFAHTTEKGTFFDETITVSDRFDPTKLVMKYIDVEGICSLRTLEYNGQEIENNSGSDTTSKAFHVALIDSSD